MPQYIVLLMTELHHSSLQRHIVISSTDLYCINHLRHFEYTKNVFVVTTSLKVLNEHNLDIFFHLTKNISFASLCAIFSIKLWQRPLAAKHKTTVMFGARTTPVPFSLNGLLGDSFYKSQSLSVCLSPPGNPSSQ